MNYWTKVLRKLIVFAISLFAIYLSFKLAIFYFPFVIAFVISLLLEPLIKFLMKKCKLKRKTSAIIIMIIIIGIILGLLSWAIATIISEGSNLLDNLGEYVTNATDFIQEFLKGENLRKFNIPESVIGAIEESFTQLINTSTTWIGNSLKDILEWLTSIPSIGVYLVITFLSLYFICTDKVYMIDQVEHHLPEIWVKKLYKHLKDIVQVLGRYLKAEATLVIVSFIISLIGLYILKLVKFNISYPLLYAIGIAFVDALPIFGSGTVMIPWAIISAFNGDINLAIAILVLWILMSVVRQFIEPRIVGNNIGIHPIFTLIAMYTGFKISGVIGLFIGPIILIILKNIFSGLIDKGVMKSFFSRDYS
ncbi:MAG: sporulation integral membrane protein YtvI [Clostridia bacterium]